MKRQTEGVNIEARGVSGAARMSASARANLYNILRRVRRNAQYRYLSAAADIYFHIEVYSVHLVEALKAINVEEAE